jgi:hypothetical protein
MAKRLIPDAQARQRYGVSSPSTFWRWDNDPDSKFPRPVIINGRKFRDIAELDAYDAMLAAERAARFGANDREGQGAAA